MGGRAGIHTFIWLFPQMQISRFRVLQWKLLVGKKEEWVGSVWNSNLWVCSGHKQVQVYWTEMNQDEGP